MSCSAWIIAKREIKSLFVSPIAYVILGIFALISGIQFLLSFQAFNAQLQQAQVQAQLMRNPEMLQYLNLNELLISNIIQFAFFLLLFTIPGITMRVFSEERNNGTYELLHTSPISTWNVIIGKFIAVSVFYLSILSTHSLFLFVMFGYGNPEAGPVFAGYLGLFLAGLAFISIGIFASSLTRNQIISFFVAMSISFLFLMIGWAAGLTSGNMATFLEGASIAKHFSGFNSGVITSSALVFFLTIIILFLSATRISVESLMRK